MEAIQITVSGNQAAAVATAPIVAGTVGLGVEFTFDDSWKSLNKTAVFRANGRTIDQLNVEKTATVPWELLQSPGCRLMIGVYGVGEGLQVPTVWAEVGVIQPGADPGGDESSDPSLPVWEQLSQDVGNALQEIINYQNRIIYGEIVPISSQEDSQ